MGSYPVKKTQIHNQNIGNMATPDSYLIKLSKT